MVFLSATDGLKHIQRANHVFSGARQETVAEHSWQVSVLAMLFADAAPDGTNHDLARIVAGDEVD